MPFSELIQQINNLAEANPTEHNFSNYVNRRMACIPVVSYRPLAVQDLYADDQGNPTFARSGTTDELQFNIALGHDGPGVVRAGLMLSFSGYPNPQNAPNPNRHRLPAVWSRLNQLASNFPRPVWSIIWSDNGSIEEGFTCIPDQPGNSSYFFGRLWD